MFHTKFLIQVNYKSGNSMQFWVYSFNIKDGEWTWRSIGDSKPVLLNVDEVESVWQLRHKRFGFV